MGHFWEKAWNPKSLQHKPNLSIRGDGTQRLYIPFKFKGWQDARYPVDGVTHPKLLVEWTFMTGRCRANECYRTQVD